MPGHKSVVTVCEDGDKGMTLTQLIDKYKSRLVGDKVYEQLGNQFTVQVHRFTTGTIWAGAS